MKSFVAMLATALTLGSLPALSASETITSEAVVKAISGPAALGNGVECSWISERNDCRISTVDGFTEVRIARPRLHNYAIAFEQIRNEILEYQSWGSDYGTAYLTQNRRYPDPRFETPDSRFRNTRSGGVPRSARQFCWHVGFVDAVDFDRANTSRERLITFYDRSSNIESLWTVDGNPDRRYETITCRGLNQSAPRHNIEIYDGSENRFNYVQNFDRRWYGRGPRDILIGMYFGSTFGSYEQDLWYSRRSGSKVVGNLEFSTLSDTYVRGSARRFCFDHHRNGDNRGGLNNVDALGYTKSQYTYSPGSYCGVSPSGSSCEAHAYREDDFGNGRVINFDKRPGMDYFRTITCYSPVVNSAPVLARGEGAASARLTSIVNAASGSTELSSGSFATIYGSDFLMPNEGPYSGDSVSQSPVRVFVGGRQAESFFVSNTQINIRLPEGLGASTQTVEISRQAQPVPTASMVVLLRDNAPAIFTANQSGSGVPAGQFYADGAAAQFISDAPISLGSSATPTVVTIWVNGINPTGPVGQPAIRNGLSVLVTGGGLMNYAAQVTYAAPSEYRGLYQVNFVVPALTELKNQRVNIKVSVDGVESQSNVYLNVGG